MEKNPLQEKKEFELFLKRKGLSVETLKLYLIYIDKINELIIETGQDLNQLLADAFLDVYPHAIGRAFLKNYLEFKNNTSIRIVKRTGRVAKKEVVIIPPHELELVRDYLYSRNEKFGLLLDVSVNCALRRQEAINIKAGDIKVVDDNMFILIKKAKGNKERTVFVPKNIAVLIIHYSFANHLKPSDYIFRSSKNPERPIDKTIWNKVFSKATFKTLGKKYHPHQLRHTRATQWFENGIDIVRIQQRLGHSNIATTRLYLNPDNKRELDKWSKEKF